MLLYAKISINFACSFIFFRTKIVKAKINKLNKAICSLVAISALSLCACTSTATKKVISADAFGPLTLTNQEYLEAYSGADSEVNFKALILLARSNIVENNLDAASANVNELLNLANTPLKQDEANIVKAMLLYKQNDTLEAYELLKSVKYNALPKQDISYYLILNSNASSRLFKQTKNPNYQVLSYKSKVALLNFIDNPSDRLTVINQSVKLLSALDGDSLSQALANAKNSTDKGFYEYAIIQNSSSEDLKAQLLTDFYAKYPNHPLNELNQTKAQNRQTATENQSADNGYQSIDKASIFNLEDGDKIAVLLPLTGRFAPVVGESAKLGILSALKDRASKSKVVFYDTNKINISSIVEKVSHDGTALIIGPILKPEVQALNTLNTKIPSVVFNYDEEKPVNQWYFDLSPNYEGAIAASKVFADKYTSPVVIAKADDTSSQRAANSFKQSFDKSSFKASICQYTDANNLSNCNFDKVDSAYISASVVDSVVLKSKLPANVSVYLTDMSYMGVNNTSQEFALKGAYLGDMPWLLTDSKLKDSFMKSLPKADTQVQKIFATAYDSVNFAFSLKALSEDENDVLHGLSGDISLGENGLIESSPMWVQLGSLR